MMDEDIGATVAADHDLIAHVVTSVGLDALLTAWGLRWLENNAGQKKSPGPFETDLHKLMTMIVILRVGECEQRPIR